MPRELWNEGRVVGYSAYEMYVKHALEADPAHEPASEKQWLASMMAMGSSMLLKVEPDDIDGLHYRDIQFPENSRLCAANTILASLFLGEGAASEDSPWCTKVTSYGPLIQNDDTASPEGTVDPTGTIPPSDLTDASTQSYVEIRMLKPTAKTYDLSTDGTYSEHGVYSFPEDDDLAGDDEPLTDDEKTLLKDIYNKLVSEYDGDSIIVGIFTLNATLSTHVIPLSSFIGTGTDADEGADNFYNIYTTQIMPNWIVESIDVANGVKYASLKYEEYSCFVCFDDAAVDIVSHTTVDKYIKEPVTEYMKIIDGIVIQPGTWVANANPQPKKDFTPTLSEYPRLRLGFSERVNYAFYLLLVGFTNRTVVDGVTGFSTAVNTSAPEDGDFLGPWQFPWSNKIIFSVPAAYISYFVNNKYTREMKSGADAITVKSDVVLDYKQDYDENYNSAYYAENDTDATLSVNVTDVNISGDDAAVLASYSHKADNTVLPPALYGALIDSEGKKAFIPMDTVAPGSLHMYHGDIDSIEAQSPGKMASALEQEAKGAFAFMRNDYDYVVHQRDADAESVIPVAKVYPTSLLGALTVSNISDPMFCVEGTYLRDGMVARSVKDHSKVQDQSASSLNTLGGDAWYATISQGILSQYENKDSFEIDFPDAKIYDEDNHIISDITEWPPKNCTVRVPGDIIFKNLLPYAGAGIIQWKRITGYLTEEIYKECGYDVMVSDGNGGYIENPAISSTTRTLVYCIDENKRKDYYVVVPGDVHGNTIVWPVRRKDHYIDVIVRFGYYIYINKHSWNIPSFYNNTSGYRCSTFLGSWWGNGSVKDLSSDKLSATTYDNGFAYIHIDGESHPTAKNLIPKNTDAQVYIDTALLPQKNLYENTTMKALFGQDILTLSGVREEYQELSIAEFLKMALYTDMGTGDKLTAQNQPANINQTQKIYTNESSPTVAFSLKLNNSEATVNKTQLVEIPEEYHDSDTNDPLGIVTTTGRLQGLSLSMADINNTPYNLYGTDDMISVLGNNNLTWYNLVMALAQNKSIDLLGDVLKEFRTHLKSSGDNYIELKNGVRLYISTSEPTDTDIPNGSIGIGW